MSSTTAAASASRSVVQLEHVPKRRHTRSATLSAKQSQEGEMKCRDCEEKFWLHQGDDLTLHELQCSGLRKAGLRKDTGGQDRKSSRPRHHRKRTLEADSDGDASSKKRFAKKETKKKEKKAKSKKPAVSGVTIEPKAETKSEETEVDEQHDEPVEPQKPKLASPPPNHNRNVTIEKSLKKEI